MTSTIHGHHATALTAALCSERTCFGSESKGPFQMQTRVPDEPRLSWGKHGLYLGSKTRDRGYFKGLLRGDPTG